MGDSRIKDLAASVTSGQLSALLSTLQLVVDDPTFTDAKKIALLSLLYSGQVTSNANNYQAMTPKAFADSIMNTTTRGIERAATDQEITDKSGTGVLNAADQIKMQEQWVVDWFRKEVTPNIYHYAGYAMAWQSVDYIDSMSIGDSAPLSPTLESARTFDSALVTLLVSSNLGEAYGIYKIPAGSGIKTSIPVMIGGVLRFYLTINSTRKTISIEAAAVNSFIRVSATIQATLL
jgi:hypothetical protein